MSLPFNFAFVQDIVLLLVSGVACLYCLLLNRRLKGLSSLKSGVGASIVSLTNAIKETHQAAKQAQSSTVESIETLNALLSKADQASAKVEAETLALQRVLVRAEKLKSELTPHVETKLPHAIGKAQNTASSLLKIVADIEKYRRLTAFKAAADLSSFFDEDDNAENENESPVKPDSHLSVVASTSPAQDDVSPLDETLSEILSPEGQAAVINANDSDDILTTIEPVETSKVESLNKDPIDELFDNIDALVQKKGVSDKKVGFLQARKYFKS